MQDILDIIFYPICFCFQMLICTKERSSDDAEEYTMPSLGLRRVG